MNITYQDRIDLTLARAEKRLLENKTAIKTYVRKKTAKKVVKKVLDKKELDIMFNSKIGGYLFKFLDGHWTISTEINVLNKLESYQEIDFVQTKNGQWCELTF